MRLKVNPNDANYTNSSTLSLSNPSDFNTASKRVEQPILMRCAIHLTKVYIIMYKASMLHIIKHPLAISYTHAIYNLC